MNDCETVLVKLDPQHLTHWLDGIKNNFNMSCDMTKPTK